MENDPDSTSADLGFYEIDVKVTQGVKVCKQHESNQRYTINWLLFIGFEWKCHWNDDRKSTRNGCNFHLQVEGGKWWENSFKIASERTNR